MEILIEFMFYVCLMLLGFVILGAIARWFGS